MSEPIRDRRPTEADGNGVNQVEYWDGEEWATCYVGGRIAENPDTWWRPIDQTPPPEPEKPKRFKAWCDSVVDSDDNEHTFMNSKKLVEWLPGDPPDLDAFLRWFDEWEASTEDRYTLYQKMKAARHGDGGEG